MNIKKSNMSGLKNKYFIEKTSGKPVDPRARYFVLRYDEHQKCEAHKRACQEALKTYAEEIAEHNDELARDLFLALDEQGAEMGITDIKAHVKNLEEAAKLDALSLHEVAELRKATVMRVPGGLIYSFKHNQYGLSSVFVPEPGPELYIESSPREWDASREFEAIQGVDSKLNDE